MAFRQTFRFSIHSTQGRSLGMICDGIVGKVTEGSHLSSKEENLALHCVQRKRRSRSRT